MQISNLYSFTYKIQKYIRNSVKLARVNKLSISFNKLKFVNSSFQITHNELLSLNNYKSSIEHYRTIFGVKNATLNTKTGVTWFENKIIEESSVWPVSDLIIWEPRPILTKKLQGSFNNLPDNGYYHFLIEDLPRYLEIINIGLDLTTIYGSKSRYIQDTFKILNTNKTLYFSCPVSCEELVLSEKTLGGIFTKSDRRILLDFAKNIQAKSKNQKIFISRRNSFKGSEERGLKNISVVEQLFISNSFKVVYLEDLSLTEQISTIKNARVVAGFHGAGLANIVWNTNKCKVIEITESRITSHFSHISSVCKHDYRFVKASELIKYSKKDFSALIRL